MTESVTVEVEATLRISRVEITSPYNPTTGSVVGVTEVLLREPATPSKDAAIMKQRSTTPYMVEGDQKTYGTMPGAQIARAVTDVLEETVEVDHKVISFQNVIDAMAAFFERWKQEDVDAPALTPLMQPPPIPNKIPERVELTPMPEGFVPPKHEVPPPL